MQESIDSLVCCQVMAIDLRGHGKSKSQNEENLSAETQVSDVISVIKCMFGEDAPPIVLIGHSMGGAVAVHTAAAGELPTLAGIIVIDVVEGTAMEALASMQSFLRSRPKHFPSIEQAIEWRYCFLNCNLSYLIDVSISVAVSAVAKSATVNLLEFRFLDN